MVAHAILCRSGGFSLADQDMINYTIDDITKPGWGIPLEDVWAVIRASDPQELVRRLKYMPYQEFLRTPYWYAVATLTKKNARYQCQVCKNSKDLQVHHRGENYEIRGNEHQNMQELTCLCERCHRMAHGLPVGNKKKRRHKGHKFKPKPGGKNYAAQGEPVAWSSWRQLGRKSHGWRGSMR